MNKRLSLSIAIAVGCIANPTIANAASSWDYLDLGYSFSGEFEVDEPGADPVDYKGYTIDTATSFNSDMFFLRGMSNSTISDGDDVGVDETDISVAEWTSVGPGLHFPVAVGGMGLDLWAQLTLNQAVVVASSVSGHGGALGARLSVSPQFETSLSYSFSSMDGDTNGDQSHFDPSLITLEGLYFISPAHAIRLGYTTGDADVEGSVLGFPDTRVDLTEFQLGYRHIFGADTGAAGNKQPPAPLSFNFVQFGYVFAGDSTIKGNGGTVDFDIASGFEIRGAFEIGDIAYFGAEFIRLGAKADGVAPGIGVDGDDISITDSMAFGPGVHLPLAEIATLYAQAGLNRKHYAYAPLDGYFGRIGVRARASMVEANIWYQKGKVEGELFGDTLELDGATYGADLALEFAPGAPELVLSYSSADDDLLYPSLDDGSVEVTRTSIGMRQRF